MIDKLKHYSLTNPASVYDEEALTALELAGRTAAKVNECVDTVNKNTKEIPSIVEKTVQEKIDDGTFDKAISEYTDDLEERVDHLLNNVPEGSTTMDAEVVDIRRGVNGKSYNSAGDAVRAQIKQRSGMAILLPASNGEYPSISTTDRTFTIGGDTLLINDRLKNGYVSLIESAGNNTVTWGTEITTSAICFYYDIDNNKLVALPYSANVSENDYILIATLRTYYKGSRAICSCPIYVDGVLSTEPFQLGGFVALLPTFDTETCYPKFSTAEKTLTFANDTLIIDPRLPSYFVSLSESNGNNVADLSQYTTSAVCVYYGIDEGSLVVKPYSTKVNAFKYLLVCTVRKPSTSERGMVWASCPVWIDDRLSTEEIGHVNLGEITTVKAINHRGYCGEAPENTLSAYKLSKKMGFDYVECDVAFTSDGEAVLLHDTTIDRTSNGTGEIANLTLDYVRSLDFGSYKSARYAGEKIPTFKEFIALCKSLGLHAYIELKAGTLEQVKKLVGIVRMYGMRDNVSYISFFPECLSYVRETDAKARLGYIVETINETVIEQAKTWINGQGEVFIDASSSAVNNNAVQLCVVADLPLEVWTVNDESAIENMNPYISGVTSDNVHAGKIAREDTLDGTMTTIPENLPSSKEETGSGGGTSSGGGTQLYKHVLMFSATVGDETGEEPLHIITLEGTPFNMQTLASDLNHRYTKLAVYLYDGSAMTPCELYTIKGGGWAVAFKDYDSTQNTIIYQCIQGDIDINTPDTVTPL